MQDYQREELRLQAERAKHHLESDCPLLEDEVAVAAWEYILLLEQELKVKKEIALRRGKILKEEFGYEDD